MFFSSSTTRITAMAQRVGERAPSCARDLDREPAPAADLALEVDPPAVRLHHVPHDRKPEPCGTRILALREALEDAIALLGRDARAAVLDRKAHRVARRPERDPDRPAARRGAERITDQVRECPAELRGISRDLRNVDREVGLERDASLARLQQEDPGVALDEIAERDLLAREPDGHRARARQLEQPLRD